MFFPELAKERKDKYTIGECIVLNTFIMIMRGNQKALELFLKVIGELDNKEQMLKIIYKAVSPTNEQQMETDNIIDNVIRKVK
jgi:hypothetical protein